MIVQSLLMLQIIYNDNVIHVETVIFSKYRKIINEWSIVQI